MLFRVLDGALDAKKVDWNVFRETASIVRHAAADRIVWRSIMGLSWFWMVGATLLSQFPSFAKDVLGGDEHVVTFLLVFFSMGVGFGSWVSHRLLKGEVSVRHVPGAALGIAIFSADLAWAASSFQASSWGMEGLMSDPGAWRVAADVFVIATCGGMFSIPLYALIQNRSDPARRSRTIAANNVVNAAFMTASAVATMVLVSMGLSVIGIFVSLAILNAAAALCMYAGFSGSKMCRDWRGEGGFT